MKEINVSVDPRESPVDFANDVQRAIAAAKAIDGAAPRDVILREFSTDGCSGGMSSSWKLLFDTITPWEGCCVQHDYFYWKGGPAFKRAYADRQLRNCVSERGYPIIAWLMWASVRIGGHPAWNTTYRWGYGCKYRMGYPK